ncbi:unnamed protein product, partial [Urochloa humidicola]
SASRLAANQPKNNSQNFSRPTIVVDLRNYQILIGCFVRRPTLATRRPLPAPATSSGTSGADGVRSRQAAAMRRDETAAACCLPPSTRRRGTSDTAAQGIWGSILCSSIKSFVGKKDPGELSPSRRTHNFYFCFRSKHSLLLLRSCLSFCGPINNYFFSCAHGRRVHADRGSLLAAIGGARF